MKNFPSYLAFALMIALAGVIVFHNVIWPCGSSGPSVSDTVHVETELAFDSAEFKVETQHIEPINITYRNKPLVSSSGTSPEPLPDLTALRTVFVKTVERMDSGEHVTLTKADTAAIVALFIQEAVEYSTTVDLPDSAEVHLVINETIGGNRILKRDVFVRNTRAISKTTINSYYADRFMVYPGLQFAAMTDLNNTSFVPLAGLDLTFKFKTNTAVRVGYMIGPNTQLYTLGVSQLLRFKKLGDAIRGRRLARIIRASTTL